ncbi:MAG: RNA polymerase sporulation sigma factor SigH [Lachnospiraceae bacterium]|nr:RNA polymerase sporulation sigma factor SigH [Lachnospiraceae bacterium]
MSRDFTMLEDEQIIRLIREEDNREAMDFLMNKYRGLVKKEARTLYMMGADSEDIIQEGMIGLFKAIRDYSPENEATFFTFAKICIQRQLVNAVKASTRKKHSPLNSYVSFYEPVQESKEVSVMDTIQAAESFSNPEKILLEHEKIESLEVGIKEKLSDLEQEVLILFLDGKSYGEIGVLLGKDAKSVDNAVQRIRNKIKKSIDMK